MSAISTDVPVKPGMAEADERTALELGLVQELAHDLRSPLTSIIFLAETLRRGQSGAVNDLQRRQLGIIYSAALSLVSLTSDVIELGRGGDRLMDPEPVPFSLANTLDSVCSILEPMVTEKSVTLRVLPVETDRRLGYPVALSRVLLNLTTNALKFTEEGFVEIMMRSVSDTRVEISVRDTGRGMDPDRLGQIYQPFRRNVEKNRYGFSGSGLGLSICRRLVAAMDSELRVESRPEWGTRFFFEIDLPPA